MNRSYRSIWNCALNSWVATAENIATRGKRSRSGRLALAGMLAINPLVAFAADECGPSTSGQTIVCTGSTSGNVSYVGKNMNVLLDGTTGDGPVNLSGLTIQNWTTQDNFDLSVSTQGPVLISGNADNLIQMQKEQGGGNLSVVLGAETTLHQTGNGYGAAIDAYHYNYNGTNINTIVGISEGARVTVDKDNYYGIAITAGHYGDGELRVSNAGLIQVASMQESNGIRAGGSNAVTVDNSGQIILQNKSSVPGYGSAIYAYASPHDYYRPTTLRINHSGTIQGDARSEDDQYIGIQADLWTGDGGGQLFIHSNGDITGVTQGIYAYTGGNQAQGLVHQSVGTIEAEQVGIWMGGSESEVEVRTSGKITTGRNTDTKGVYITSSSGGLLALGRFTQEAGGDIYDQGTTSDSAGVYVEGAVGVEINVSGRIRSATGNGVFLQEAAREYIAVGPSGAPPYLLSEGKSTFKVDVRAGSVVEGGSSGAGIATVGGNQSDISIHQGATLGALSDTAIQAGGYYTEDFAYYEWDDNIGQSVLHEIDGVWIAPGQTTVRNAGTITGTVQLGSGQDTVINELGGVWNLRSFSDSDGDQIRDTVSVAVSRFTTLGNNNIVNQGTINVLGDNGLGLTLNDSGAYQTGYAVNTMTLGGAAQAQILGVQTFTNGGIINMQDGSNVVGDVLLISGGYTPGTSGGGTYVADGGQIRVDTVLNEGGSNSQSDMLIVDSTRLGSAATLVDVNNAGGSGAQTVGNGIELIRVLDSSQSADGVFKLGGRVVAGAYEYDLYRGGVGGDAGDGNWYLRSMPVTALRPEAGVYLRNMVAASGMFMHSLYNRYGEPQYGQTYQAGGTSMLPTTWVRMTASHTDSKAADGLIDMETKTALLHFGADLFRKTTETGNRWHAGLMGAYGRSDVDADPVKDKYNDSGIRRTASGKVEGYSVGAYATWYGNKDSASGPYVDSWAQYAWYKNKVQGNTLAKEEYDSTGWTVSVEGGYAFVASDGERRQWMIEPQVQVAYNSYKADDHHEANGTWVRGNDVDGAIFRVGARFYSQNKLDGGGVQPFIETNWWYSDAKNSLSFDGDILYEDTPNSRYELKAGLQGNVTKHWQLWGHLSGQWGENSYSRYEGMLGVKYSF